ncbi:hypothetical protein LJC55_03210, partial [Eubacteriales bacterium OttesenSCG-928-N14]|nr:hypothetical protein [Eubacteriales bacterium OttesenSCG-928-N14]
MRSRAQLKQHAKASLSGHYGTALGAMLVARVLAMVPIIGWLLFPALNVGYCRFNSKLVRG